MQKTTQKISVIKKTFCIIKCIDTHGYELHIYKKDKSINNI